MVRVSGRVIRERIEPGLAEEALVRVKAATESRTLREALRVQRSAGSIFIGVPHYWAVYYHDGRTPAHAPPGKFLIWFPNPQDDPRHGGQFPVRASEIQRLNLPAEELRNLIETGVAVVARVSPRSLQNVKGKKFFDRGLRNFFAKGNEKAPLEFSRYMKEDLDLVRFETHTLTVKL